MDLRAHYVICGKGKEPDLFNWTKKLEVAAWKASNDFKRYPGGHKTFFINCVSFFNDPIRFTYTPPILCKGMRPFSSLEKRSEISMNLSWQERKTSATIGSK